MFLALTALVDEPRHGYGIVQEVDCGRELKIGTLYGVLDRLSAAGLVAPDREEVQQGPGRGAGGGGPALVAGGAAGSRGRPLTRPCRGKIGLGGRRFPLYCPKHGHTLLFPARCPHDGVRRIDQARPRRV
ncbi:PadR family transcriptional regulator [Nonomuraea basaltis]|uniref:PadR family transcriptional regulator n=1 Tax=Nonomuraea basaltis TaxID=2495887 RepID=UPI00110C5767|nr:PadR family transcriptional regulator [Nonomuraea basaltis]TMR91483.1 PadR family transcriptional regulator [Nonomuraea basaltis]